MRVLSDSSEVFTSENDLDAELKDWKPSADRRAAAPSYFFASFFVFCPSPLSKVRNEAYLKQRDGGHDEDEAEYDGKDRRN